MTPFYALVALCVAINVAFYVHDRRAKRKGYQMGRRDADNWWIGVEEDVAAERRKLWMEESRKP